MHELGHIVMGLILKIKPEKLEIMPSGLSVSFHYNLDDKSLEIKEILIALAGPITSLILIIFCRYINLKYITIEEAIYSNILILIFNLIPIYPLDGGRVINGILKLRLGTVQSENIIDKISNTTLIILTIVSSIAVYYFRNIAIFFICLFLWMVILTEKNKKRLAILPGK